jgi:rod shape determining protein RodA
MVNVFTPNKKQSIFASQDWILNFAALALSFIGVLLVYAATKPRLEITETSTEYYLIRHVGTLLVGVVLAILISRSQYTLLRAYAPILYLVGVIGLIVVLIPGIGTEINGIRAWIAIPGGFTLQPAELAKLAIVLGMSMILAEAQQPGIEPEDKEVGLALLLAAIPLGLILLQPDLGTAIIVGVIILAVIAISAAGMKWIFGLVGSALFAMLLLVVLGILDEYQINRLLTFIDPGRDPLVSGYNLIQVKLAIGTGGFTGWGLFDGPQTNGRFIPSQQTDFIYATAGEAFGFIGGVLIIALLGIVTWRALLIAQGADRFGRLAATGVAAWLGFQTFQNIGMNLGIMPITGVPLPFISYGGTSMFAVWMAVGLLQNIRGRSRD